MRWRLVKMLAIGLAVLFVFGCGEDMEIKPSKSVVNVGETVTFKSYVLEDPGCAITGPNMSTAADYFVDGKPLPDASFTPTEPGKYTIHAADKIYNAYSADVVIEVLGSAETPQSAETSDGVSFSVDESSGAQTEQPGTIGTGAQGFAGTYKGTLPLAMDAQSAQVPFEFTVDVAGKVEGGFEHEWSPQGAITQYGIKATFSGTVGEDGRLIASGKAKSSGTNGGTPFSTVGAITVSGTISGNTFSGGFGANAGEGWTAQRQ